MVDSHHVLVIGGGISGTATAYELARRGIRVTLVEQGDLHSMASGWSLAGVRQSGRHPAELPLAHAAVRRWEQLAEELGHDVEYRQHGNLRIALTEDDLSGVKQVVDDGIAAGISMEYLEGSEAVRAIAPTMTEDVVGASFCPTDGHANNELAVRAFADAAMRHGAMIRTNTRVLSLLVDHECVTGVQTIDGPMFADTVVMAAGIYTPHLLEPLGLTLPIDPVLCPVVQTEAVEPMLAQVIGVVGGTFAGRQEASGRFRFTGASLPWPESFHTQTNTAPALQQLQETIADGSTILPALNNVRIHRTWGGLIDHTPDVIPVLDKVPTHEGLVVGAGFSGHGFCLGPITGEILADLATTGTTDHPIDAFQLDRFQHGGVQRQELQLHG